MTSHKFGVEVFKALSHPTRIKIIKALRGRSMSPVRLSTEFGMPLSDVSYHARFLAEIGLAEIVSSRPVRGATEHIYSLTARGTSVLDIVA